MRRPPSPPWAPIAALLITALVLSASSAASPGITTQRQKADALAGRTHRELLDLYAIESQLVHARAGVVTLRTQVVHVQAQRALVQRQLRIARQAYLVSRRSLALHLRTIYESGNVDALSVLLGSRSLDSALTNIDALHRMAAQSRRVLAQTTVTGRRLKRLSLELDAHITKLAVLQRNAERETASLVSARSQRLTLIATLRTREQLSRQAVSRLVSAAQSAQAKSQRLSAVASDPAPDDPPSTSPSPTPVVTPGSTQSITVVATGYSIHGHTATGVTTGWGVAAVDPSVIPLGTRFSVPGYGTAVAADVGSGVRGAMIDLWFPTIAGARAWGRKSVTITIQH